MIIRSGASRGIGRAIAYDLASRGANVLATCSATSSVHHINVLAHNLKDLYSVPVDQQHAVAAGPKVIGIAADMMSADCATKIADALAKEFNGKLDILVQNASLLEDKLIGEIDANHVSRSLYANIESPIMLVEQLVKQSMFRPNSRIVNISSDRARDPVKGRFVTHY
jgi:3-oxoacyl-[acyl-carrier protein] reductase